MVSPFSCAASAPLSGFVWRLPSIGGRCAEAGIIIERNLVGSYCTSLDMQGVSITLLNVDDEYCPCGMRGENACAALGVAEEVLALTKQQVVDWLMRCGEVFSRGAIFSTQLDTGSAMPTSEHESRFQ